MLRHANGELAHALLAHGKDHGDLPALILPQGPTVSYGGLAKAAQACCLQLQERKVEPGQRVAIVLQDHPGFPAWYAGVQMAGAVPCPISVHQTNHEIAKALRAVAPCCVLAEQGPSSPMAGAPPIFITPPWDGSEGGPPPLTADRGPAPPNPEPTDWEDIAAVHVTYRGLGRPLGVMHRASAQRAAAKAFCQGTSLSSGDLVLGMLPFAHIFSFTANLLAPLCAGATLLLAHGVRGDDLPGLVEQYRPDVGFLTPAQAERLADIQLCQPSDLSSLKRLWCGGAPFGAELVERFNGASGLRLLQGYGLTEAFVVCANPNVGEEARPETIGLAFPGYRLRVVGPGDQPLPDGEEGELMVAGEPVTAGFLNEPEASREALRGGWLATGDLAIREPDGQITFRGWSKRIIKTLGLVVDLAEIETELRDLIPGAGEIALSPRPRPRWGHVLAARVEVDGPLPDPEHVRELLEQRLSFFKLPQPLELVPAGDR